MVRAVDPSPYASLPRASRTLPLRPLVGGVLALAMGMGIGRFAYTPLLPAMQNAAHLGTGQAGFLASANFAGYLVGALLLTFISPGEARSRLLATSLVTVAVTTAVMACTTSFGVWCLIRFLGGVASAAVFILASDAVLAVIRRERRTALSGWLYSGVGVGIVASGMTAHVVTGPNGWRHGWLALGVLAAAMVYPAWRWLSHGPNEGNPIAQTRAFQVPPLTLSLAFLVAAYTLAGAGYIVTGTFLVAIVDRTPGLAGLGPGIWIVVGLAVIPCTPLWGVVGGHVGHAPALVLAYFIQACAILLPVLSGGAAIAFAAALLFGGTFMALAALTMILARYVVSEASTGVIALLTLAFSVGQIVAPSLAGIAASRSHSFRPALIAAGIAMLAAAFLIAALDWYQRTQTSKSEEA